MGKRQRSKQPTRAKIEKDRKKLAKQVAGAVLSAALTMNVTDDDYPAALVSPILVGSSFAAPIILSVKGGVDMEVAENNAVRTAVGEYLTNKTIEQMWEQFSISDFMRSEYFTEEVAAAFIAAAPPEETPTVPEA